MWYLGRLKLVIPLDVFVKEEIALCRMEYLKQHPHWSFPLLQADTGLHAVATD